MEKAIEFEEKSVKYRLKVSGRARGVRLTITSGGVFTVTAPPWMGQSRIEKFIFEKSEWVLDKIRYFSSFPRVAPLRRVNRRKHFVEHKEKALALARERLEHFNKFCNFRWNRVGVRNQKSRWGSCSEFGNLNFNYKIFLLPPHLADYIVVHELCHLAELNHSDKFWQLVAKTLPDYRRFRKELRTFRVSFD